MYAKVNSLSAFPGERSFIESMFLELEFDDILNNLNIYFIYEFFYDKIINKAWQNQPLRL